MKVNIHFLTFRKPEKKQKEKKKNEEKKYEYSILDGMCI